MVNVASMPTGVGMNRLVIVSNRLPISVKKAEDNGSWSFQLSSGGLVSALQGLQKTTKFLWIGWPGLHVEKEERQAFDDALLKQYSALPVYIDEKTSDLHYKGFSNSTIWPLFHYLPGDIDFNNDQWAGYVSANELFADKIASLVDDGDCIWIHDYHLMLLPKMLRERCKKNVSIGFFLHIPFPASDVYRALPYRKEILEGLLASDLVGFHIYEYARHFLASCTRILGVNASPSSIDYKGRTVKVGAYPVGIGPEKFLKCLEKPSTIARVEELKVKFKGLSVIVGVERLDYIKGLTQKLLAFESFLDQCPEYRGKVVLLQIAIPSRGDVVEYQCLQNQVFELVGRINGKYSRSATSSPDYSPVQFIHNSVSFEELVALYHLAEVCLITSTRDGMNLVAYEYIASQRQKCGVLVLSEFAGAAQSLNGSILINPWSISDIKNALKTALKMTMNEKALLHSHLFAYVEKFTAERWGTSFVGDLIECYQVSKGSDVADMKLDDLFHLSSKKILIFTSHDDLHKGVIGSLTEDLKMMNAEATVVSHLIEDSTASKKQVDLGSTLIFNYGSELYHPSVVNIAPVNRAERKFVVPEALKYVLNYYLERCPGSKIIDEQSMIIWDFSKSEVSLGEWTSCELQINLEKLIGHQALKVIKDEKCIIITDATFEFEELKSIIKKLIDESGADCVITSLSSHLIKKEIGKMNVPVFNLQITPQQS